VRFRLHPRRRSTISGFSLAATLFAALTASTNSKAGYVVVLGDTEGGRGHVKG